MSGEATVRWTLGALGVVAGLFGAYLLWSRSDTGQLVDTGIWLGAGVVAHDALIAGLTLLLVALVTRLSPPAARAPATVALVVLGPLTLIAIPFLGRFGAKADNPSLLDRPYLAGYLVVVGIVLLAAVVAGVVRTRRADTEVADTPSKERGT